MSENAEKYYRLDWMSDDQWECACMFADVVGGFHHVSGKFKEFGQGIKVNSYNGGWATWDFNLLTKLVIYGHDRMIRVSLEPSGPRMIGFAMWKRHSRTGGADERHPTIQQAVEIHSKPIDEVSSDG